MHSLANVPTKTSGLHICTQVDGPAIHILRSLEPTAKWGDGKSILMTSLHVGDHMMQKPNDLREMYGRDIAMAIRLGRDAGYAQAQADIKAALGLNGHG